MPEAEADVPHQIMLAAVINHKITKWRQTCLTRKHWRLLIAATQS